jgi:hypothetical protein
MAEDKLLNWVQEHIKRHVSEFFTFFCKYARIKYSMFQCYSRVMEFCPYRNYEMDIEFPSTIIIAQSV